jgi:hypothetical protein
VLRGLSVQLVGGLWNEGDADYADYTDYTDFEICLDCFMRNIDAFGAEDFAWKFFGFLWLGLRGFWWCFGMF